MTAASRKKVPQAIPGSRRQAPLLKLVPPAIPPTARTLGYARVSTEDQNLDVQITALKAAGCDQLFIEKVSAVNAKRPAFDLMMKLAEPGDTILFHNLSRMGREVHKLHAIITGLDDQDIAWRSLTEPHLNNATAVGKFMLNITGSLAQLERDQISERTLRGMAECKRQGMSLGAPRKVSPADAKTMKRMRFKQKLPVPMIAKRFNVSQGAVYTHTNRI